LLGGALENILPPIGIAHAALLPHAFRQFLESPKMNDLDAQEPSLQSTNITLNAIVEDFFAACGPASPGGSVSVLRGGREVLCRSFGMATIEHGLRWSRHVPYPVASITKSFVAQAILHLQALGLLTLDDRLGEHLPEVAKSAADLALKNLLSMTSGLPSDEACIRLSGLATMTTPYLGGGPDAASPMQMASMALALEDFDFPPGKGQAYSDTNYRLLGLAIEAVTKQTLSSVLERLIFKPAGMTSAEWMPITSLVLPGVANEYLATPDAPNGLTRAESVMPCAGDGAAVASMDDMIRWVVQLIWGDPADPAHLSHLVAGTGAKTPLDRYRFGVRVARHRGLTVFEHAGVTGTRWIYVPDLDLAVVVLLNWTGRLRSIELIRPLIDAEIGASRQASTQRWGLPDENTSAEAGLPVGQFHDPDSGLALREIKDDAGATHSLAGARLWLTRSADGKFRNSLDATSLLLPFVEISPETEDRLTLYLNGAAPAVLRRSVPCAALHVGLAGVYMATAWASGVRVTYVPGPSILVQIGSGLTKDAVILLDAVEPTVFVARDLSVPIAGCRFLLDTAGQVTGFVASSLSPRRIFYRRVSSVAGETGTYEA
jgi:D-aminopeptidase